MSDYKYKVGDRVKCLVPMWGLKKDVIYIIEKVELDQCFINAKVNGYSSSIHEENIKEYFKLIKKELLTEVDYLDAFQENFRDA